MTTDASRPSVASPFNVAYVLPNPYPPRLHLHPTKLGRLAESIRKYGFVGYIEARLVPDDSRGQAEVTFGQWRLEAARRAGHEIVPVAVVDRSDGEMAIAATIEHDLLEADSYWAEAVCLDRMARNLDHSVAQIAGLLGRGERWAKDRLALVGLPEGNPLREAVKAGAITPTAAHAILARPEGERDRLLEDVLAGRLAEEELEQILAIDGGAEEDDPPGPTTEALARLIEADFRGAGVATPAPKPRRFDD